MVHRPQRELFAGGNVRDICLAREPFAAVDHHAARAAHRDAAGESKRDRRVLLALNFQQHIEHGRGRLIWKLKRIGLKTSIATGGGIVSENANGSLRRRHGSVDRTPDKEQSDQTDGRQSPGERTVMPDRNEIEIKQDHAQAQCRMKCDRQQQQKLDRGLVLQRDVQDQQHYDQQRRDPLPQLRPHVDRHALAAVRIVLAPGQILAICDRFIFVHLSFALSLSRTAGTLRAIYA